MNNIFESTRTRPEIVVGTDKDVVEHPPLKGFPPGKLRLRIRPEMPVKAVVVNNGVAREFLVFREDGHWVPGFEIARNQTVPNMS